MTHNRDRNINGRWRDKRDDTHIGTIEETYWIDLWVRSDMHLWTYQQQNWYSTLSEILRDKR